MGREFTVYGLRFSKTSFWNHVNTGFLDPAVATALTACGIETRLLSILNSNGSSVATALTACGIETVLTHHIIQGLYSVATALTACGIETPAHQFYCHILYRRCNSAYRLRY